MIASPCSMSWDAMDGDERSRNCGACSKTVYNISDMSAAEAEAFLHKHRTSECMKFYRRKDGTVITDDCPVGLRRIRNAWRFVHRTASSVIALFISFAGSASAQQSVSQAQQSSQCSGECEGGTLVVKPQEKTTKPADRFTYFGVPGFVPPKEPSDTEKFLTKLTKKDEASKFMVHSYLDNTVHWFETKAADAKSIGDKPRAKIYYQAALKAFDALSLPGDLKYRQHLVDLLEAMK